MCPKNHKERKGNFGFCAGLSGPIYGYIKNNIKYNVSVHLNTAIQFTIQVLYSVHPTIQLSMIPILTVHLFYIDFSVPVCRGGLNV